MDISKVRAKDKKDGKVKVFSIATATQEQVNTACSDWLDEHGATMTRDANGYVKLGGTANGN